MTLSKDIKFDCAHVLSDYNGKCANLHGHTYHGKVTIIAKGPDVDTCMIMDYNDIKYVVDQFDHAAQLSSAAGKSFVRLLKNHHTFAVHYALLGPHRDRRF